MVGDGPGTAAPSGGRDLLANVLSHSEPHYSYYIYSVPRPTMYHPLPPARPYTRVYGSREKWDAPHRCSARSTDVNV
ncbi:hypothetical protein EVAR_88662_1 [Eumeta japonica]|uniref:Uncharacterized protein n=1 Tax=Eumeta variegata TaxID=151549 RepID=A0A4C1Y7C7_EUMVA|nr:hypothetical protein EVAR_88662_1 [Eumeta japonica]